MINSYWDKYWNGLLNELKVSEDEILWFNQKMARRFNQFPEIYIFSLKDDLFERDVLEIGCGLGQDSVNIANDGARLTTIDLSQPACYLTGRHLAAKGLSASVMNLNAEDLPFNNESFDIVYSFGVFMHSQNPQAIIDESYRVLRHGGMLKAMIYNRISLSGLVFYYLAAKKKHTPFVSLRTAWDMSESPRTKAYTEKELRRMFGSFNRVKITQSFMMEQELVRTSPMLNVLWGDFKHIPKQLGGCHLIEAYK